MRVGVTQIRTLMRMAADPNGTGEVSSMSAPGLVNKGLATYVRRAAKPSSPCICQITDAGRAFLATAAAETIALRTKLRRAERCSPDRADGYLQRALEAERKAAMGSDSFRREMLDIAAEWRDLARQVVVLGQGCRATTPG